MTCGCTSERIRCLQTHKSRGGNLGLRAPPALAREPPGESVHGTDSTSARAQGQSALIDTGEPKWPLSLSYVLPSLPSSPPSLLAYISTGNLSRRGCANVSPRGFGATTPHPNRMKES